MSQSLSIISTEKQYNLDISVEQRRPHWSIVNDILALYRSAIIYSNGQYKIISDRADLPLRQVFHSGNVLPDKTEITIGGDPFRPNQANVQFSNQSLDYIGDVIYVQDSASIYGRNEPLKIIDYSLTGIARYTEAYRQGSVHLRRKIEIQRQVKWVTDLEGIAVEPGDKAIVGISMTNFEAGYGGRAVDGSSLDLVADRQVAVASGYSYDFYVWHSATDSVEQRVLVNSPGTWITLTPNSGFNAQVVPGDRWAVGVNSQDLIPVRVLSVKQDQDGTTEILGEEFKPVTFDIVCVDSRPPILYKPSPSQPATATFVVSLCQLCINVVTAVSCEGGALQANVTGSNTRNLAFLSSSHNPMPQSLVADTITFVTGAQSGASYNILAWGGSCGILNPPGFSGTIGSFTACVNPQFGLDSKSSPASGDQYYISHRTPTFGGFRVEANQGTSWDTIGYVFATSGCLDISATADILPTRIIPFSDLGVENTNGGYWTSSKLATPGCSNLNFNSTSRFVSGQSLQPFYAFVFPGSSLLTANEFDATATGLLTEACSPQGIATDLTLSLVYGSATIASLGVSLNTAASESLIGSLSPIQVSVLLTAVGSTGRQFGKITYEGANVNSSYYTAFNTGYANIDSTKPQTFGVYALFTSTASQCFSLKFTSAIGDFTDVSCGGGDL